MIIGIDPGLTGAIAIIGHNGSTAILLDMPIVPKLSGKGNELSARLLLAALSAHRTDIDAAYVERVHAMPGQGVTGMFSLGRSVGVIDGILAALGIQTFYVEPTRWKRALDLTGKEKDAARTMAISLYPDAATNLSRKKDIGRADALLIAHWGLTRNTKEKAA
jgi:crossover junction endodeoxyribonuclease RuvC